MSLVVAMGRYCDYGREDRNKDSGQDSRLGIQDSRIEVYGGVGFAVFLVPRS